MHDAGLAHQVGPWGAVMLRNEILNAAARLFVEKGYHRTGIGDIARAAGMSEMGLYREATGKQDILLAILDRGLDQISADISSVVNSDLKPEQKLRLALQMYVGWLCEDVELSRLIVLEYRNLEEDYQAQHIERRDRFEELWRQIIQEGVQAGVFRPLDVSLLTFAVLGVQNWMLNWYREGRLRPIEISDRFADLLLHGILVNS